MRWFFGLARNSGGYSLPMIGTPCEVPEPRKINENAIPQIFVLRNRNITARFSERIFMLATVRIKNLALVDDLTLELQPGYNVITGETGAGKSILIGARFLMR